MDFPFRKSTLTGNLILKWDRLNDEGSTIANKIANLGLTMFCDVLLDNKWNWEESHANNAFGNSSELQELHVLNKKIDKLKFQYGTGRKTPLFQTWPTSQFDVPSKRYEAYKRDRTLKRAILQELAHTTTSQWCTSPPQYQAGHGLLPEGLLQGRGCAWWCRQAR
uniref:Uncharacterized protein n=1 Tax=Oncorhynchus kisutch TaxID=8019 RepID=A0A8C7G1C0_ONCKI